MGNQISQQNNALAEDVLSRSKLAIVDKCEAYLDFVEDTKATVDTGIKDLSADIALIIADFSNNSAVAQLDVSAKLEMERALSHFGNLHKFSVRRMLTAFHHAHNTFADMLEINVYNKPEDDSEDAHSDDNKIAEPDQASPVVRSSNVQSEDDLFAEAFSFSNKVVSDYEIELGDVSFPAEHKSSRVSRFRRLLYKSFDLAISESIELAIYGRKESAFFRIDAAFRSGLECGAFSGNEVVLCREVIHGIIQVANEEIHKLMQMPYLNEIAVDLAARDILSYSISAVRQCQLCYSTDLQALSLLMDNEFDNYFHAEDGASTSSDGEEMPVIQISNSPLISKSGPNAKSKKSTTTPSRQVVTTSDELDQEGTSLTASARKPSGRSGAKRKGSVANDQVEDNKDSSSDGTQRKKVSKRSSV